jgi:hypothetical protein
LQGLRGHQCNRLRSTRHKDFGGSGICAHYRVNITCKEMMMMAVY